MQTLPVVGRTRVMGLCPPRAPACPRCGAVFGHTEVPPDGRVLKVCARKPAGERCGGRAYVIGMDADFCVVIAISEAEWHELASRRAVDVLRGLGVLIEAVTKVNGGGR